jgi:hypothetical protein
MIENTPLLDETPAPLGTDSNIESQISPAIGQRGVQNQGGFLTPYFLFDLLERQHEDELDPAGRDSNRRFLKKVFRLAMRGWGDMSTTTPTFQQTWKLWYETLFEVLGFTQLRRLDAPLETSRYGLVPVSHALYSNAYTDEAPLILVDLHPFGTDLDHAHYPSSRARQRSEEGITSEPISRAIEFVLDHNQTRWALLSNGSELRLYRKGGSIARQYLKIDFPALFDNDNDKEWLVFWGLFRLAAFLPPATQASEAQAMNQRCLLERIIEESQRHATKIANDLRENMVRAVEALLQGIIDSPLNRHLWQGMTDAKRVPSEEQLKELFRETIYLLYRLLFILYAESRDLLPVSDSEVYRETYSVEHLRKMAEPRIHREDFDKTYYIQSLRTLFDMLRNGYPPNNPSTGDPSARAKSNAPFVIPPYNGQLFDPARTSLLDQCHIPDRSMREVVLELSLSHPKNRHERRERYSYADLGVDQLGSIYEGLLVYEPSIAEQAMVEARIKGETRLVPREQADDLELDYDHTNIKPAGSFLLRIWGGRRKGSGSYYTPQEITAFLVKDALAPLIEPIVEGCAQWDEQGKPLRSAGEILKLKVCDPAMGSGAFLVQACRYLGEAYGRALIAEGRSDHERISPAELARYKRRVAEKCIYGVDLNPLAVELAKVSLWLETLAQDRPLTFLDAHLRCGNALIGAPLRNQAGKLDSSRLVLLPTEAFGRATKEDTQAFKEMLKELTAANRKQLKTQIKEILAGQLSFLGDAELRQVVADYERKRFQLEESDENKSMEEAVALVHWKEELLQEALTGGESQVRRFKQLCDLWCAAWFWPVDAPVNPPTTVRYYDLAGVIFERPGSFVPENAEEYFKVVRKLAEEEMHFFHWEVEFPEVWYDDDGNPLPNGGFDVIVGNPPWDTVKPNSQEFWSNYLPTFRALGKQAALRAANEMRSEAEKDVRWRQYFKLLSQQAYVFKQPTFFARQGGGDINTYKLFLERMVSLTRAGGTFTIVVPSGIYTDKFSTSLRELLFFQERTRFVLSVENRGGIFPIHRSTKIVLLSGQKKDDLAQPDERPGKENTQMVACLFLVGKDNAGRDLAPSIEGLGMILPELNRRLLQILSPTIRKFAPGTLSLMEFKSQRDIDLAMKIYNDHPLLGDRLEDTWNITMQREFHMTDDSHLFNEVSEGWLLWEGKMIYQLNSGYAQPRYWIDENVGITELVRRAEIKDYQPSSEEWIANEPKLGCTNYRLVYRDVASGTNEITLIAAILPICNFIGNTLIEFVQWTYLPEPHFTWIKHFDESNKLLLAGLLNSFVLNFIIRQKVSAHVSMFLMGQLPVPRLPATHPVSQVLVPLVARLTCIDERFAPLWEELASHHADFMALQWSPDCAAVDPVERAQLRAEIDARVADLYGLTTHEFAYILSTFPLLDRNQPVLPEEPRSFVTRDLVLLALFTLRGETPPVNIVPFFTEAGVDIHHQTGAIVDLQERVRIARQELGAVAYQPSGHARDETENESEEQDDFDFEDEE